MKILFLEDRPGRQLQFLPNKEKDVEKIQSFKGLYMPEVSKCKEIIAEINQGDYNFSESLLLIIVHKSALDTIGTAYLNKVCQREKIKLVFFSGAISQLIYNNETFEMLDINSADFYTKRLIPFMERVTNGQPFHLLEIANEQWELSYLFMARQIIYNLKLEKEDDSIDSMLKKLEQIQKIVNLDFNLNEDNFTKLNIIIKEKILQS